MGIYKSRGYAILKTLADHGLITRNEETKRYSLGPALIHLSRKALENLDIRDTAQPYLLKLAEKTQGTVLLGVISNDNLLVVAKQDGNSHLGITIEIGHRFHLTTGGPDYGWKESNSNDRRVAPGEPEELLVKGPGAGY